MSLIGDMLVSKAYAVDAANSLIGTFAFKTWTLETAINSLINLAFGLIGLVAFVFLVTAGFQYMTAGGDSAKTEKARNTIVNAIIGIVIVFIAWGLVTYLGNFFKK